MSSYNNEFLKFLMNKKDFQIFCNLQDSVSSSEISEKTRFNLKDVDKTISVFSQYNLVEKNKEKINLTKLGRITLMKLLFLKFLSNHSDYFSSHEFDDIPQSLLSRIEDLSNGAVITNVWPTNTRLKEIASGASSFLNCIFTQPPFLLADLLYEKMHNDIQMNILFGENSDVPDCNDLVEKLELNKPKQSTFFEKKICEKVTTNILISDVGACLMLGFQNGITDMQQAIVGLDKQFIDWCNDFFNFKWEQGKSFARLRV
jgi:predicted transcriptional regulator